MLEEYLNGNLTNVEKIIVSTINMYAEQIIYWNINQLAEKAFTTRSSVIKTLQKVGISGFKELKRLILANAVSFKDVTENDDSKMLESIIRTEQNIQTSLFEKLYEMIRSSQSINIISGAGVLFIAKHFANMLNQLGFPTIALDLVDSRVNSLQDEAIVIFLSNSGLNSNMHRLCLSLKKNKKVKMIGITASVICNVRRFLDLHIFGGEMMYSDWEYTFPIQGSIVLTYICNKIIYKIISLDKEKQQNFVKQ